MKSEEEGLRGGDGLRLFLTKRQASNPRGIAILVHGLGEHSGRYQTLAEDLTAGGFSTWTFDHRGHGRSEGRRGDCRSFFQFTEDLHLVVEKAHSADPKFPLFLIGHSLGGLIALHYAAEHPETLRGVALSSPALKLSQEVPKVKVVLAETLSRILPVTSIPNGVNPAFLSRSPEVVAAYEKDPLVHRLITARCAILLRRAMEESILLPKRIAIPLLILQAGNDRVCDPQATAQFAKAMDPRLVTFHRYDGLYHEIFNEPERKQVIHDLLSWMTRILEN